MLEQENANLRRRVAVAAQKKEEVKKKVLFAQFNTVAAEVERVHTRPPCEEVNLEPVQELTKAMMQLEVSHREAKLEHDAAKEKSVVEGEKQAKELAAEKERVQMVNIELERELASVDDEIKTLTKKLNELEMFKKVLDEEDLRLAKMSEDQERELQRLDQRLVDQQTEIRAKENGADRRKALFNAQRVSEEQEIDELEKKLDELLKLKAKLKNTAATEEDELLDMRTVEKDLAAENEETGGVIKQLEEQILVTTGGKSAEDALMEKKQQIAAAEMATKVAECQGSAMAEVMQDKEQLVERNKVLVQDLERLAEEDREIGGKLAGTKVVLDKVKKDVVEADTNLKRIEEKKAEQEKRSQELKRRMEDEGRRRKELQDQMEFAEKEMENETTVSVQLKFDVEEKSKRKEVEIKKEANTSAVLQQVRGEVAKIKEVRDRLVLDVKRLTLERTGHEQTLACLRSKEEELATQITAEEGAHQELDVIISKESQRHEELQESVKQVDEQLQQKNLEKNEMERVAAELEIQIGKKCEEYQGVVKQIDCLGKESPPCDREAEQAKHLIAEQNRKLEEVQKELARAKEEEELKLKETEQESVEAKEMKTKLSECRVESNKVGGEEKLWRRRVKDTAAELANSEAELTKMKSTVEAASAENAKLAEENKSLSQTYSNLQAEEDAVRKKKLNFGEELSLVSQAQAEKMRLAVEKKNNLATEVGEIEMKAQEADEENEKLKRDLREKQKAIEDMKKQVEEKKKQAQARASAALSTPKLPKFAHSQSSRPNLVPTSSLNKGLHPLQTKGSKRPVLKTDVHKEKLGNFGSHLTPRSNKSAPEALARAPSKSPSLSDFRNSRDSKLKPAQKNNTFDLSSDDNENGNLSTPRTALTTPRKE